MWHKIVTFLLLYFQIISGKLLTNYNYKASVLVFSEYSEKPETGYDIEAILKVYSKNNLTIYRISNIKSTQFNGDIKLPNIALTEKAKFLEWPFKMYNQEMYVAPDDPVWSINMKRAVAEIFNFDTDKLCQSNIKSGKIKRDETNIYGHCKNVKYYITANGDRIEVKSNINFDHCKETKVHLETTRMLPCACETEIINPDREAVRTYTLGKSNSANRCYEVTNYTSTQKKLIYSPFNVNTTYIMESNLELGIVAGDAPNEEIPDNMTKKVDLSFEHVQDLSQGRHPKTQEESINISKELLNNLVEILDNTRLLHDHKLNSVALSVAFHLSTLDLNHFTKLYEELKGDNSNEGKSRLNLFLEFLPHVGTQSSVLLLKNMIIEKNTVWEMRAIKMLAEYPFHFHETSETFLDEVAVFINLGEDIGDAVRNTATLSFATLVYNTYTKGKCSKEVFEKYVSKYFDLYKTNDEYQDKVLYLQGLSNLQYGTVEDKIISIISDKDEWHGIRLVAIGSLMNHRIFPNRVHDAFFKILTDENSHFEIKTAALTLLLVTDNTGSRINELYEYFQAHPDSYLYEYFRIELETMTKSKMICSTKKKELAESVLGRMYPKPVAPKPAISRFSIDNLNSDTGITNSYILTFIGKQRQPDDGIIFSYAKTTQRQILSNLGFFYRYLTPSKPLNGVKMVDVLKETGVKAPNTTQPHVDDFIAFRNGKIIYYQFGFIYELQKLSSPWLMTNAVSLVNDSIIKYNQQFIVSRGFEDRFETTAFGTLTYNGFGQNSLYSLSGKVDLLKHEKTLEKKEVRQNMHLANLDQLTMTIAVYNPILNTHLGISKVKSYKIDFANDVKITSRPGDTLVTTEWYQSPVKNSLVLIGQTEAFTGSSEDFLFIHKWPKSESFLIRKLNSKPKPSTTTLITIPLKEFGLIARLNSSFISYNFFEKYITQIVTEISKIKETLKNERNKAEPQNVDWNFFKEKLSSFVLKISNDMDNFDESGNYLITLEILPAFEFETTYELKYNFIEAKWSNVFPMRRWNISNTYSGKLYPKDKPEKEMNFWNISISMSQDEMIIKDLKLSVLAKKPETPYVMMCLNYTFTPTTEHDYFYHYEADLKSLDLIPKSYNTLNFSFAANEQFEFCPQNTFFQVNMINTISDERKKNVELGNVWPFDDCKNYMKNKPFNPAVEACKQAAIKMSTYDKHYGDITVKNLNSDFFENTGFGGVNEINEYFKKGDTEIQFVSQENLQFTFKNKTEILEYSIPDINIHALKIEDKNNYVTCVISLDLLKDFNNNTINYITSNKYIAIAERSNTPRFMVLIENTGDYINMKYLSHLYEEKDILPDENQIRIVSKSRYETSDFAKVWHNPEDKNEVKLHIRYLGGYNLKITHRKTVIIITGSPILTFGICNPHDNHYLDFAYGKTL